MEDKKSSLELEIEQHLSEQNYELLYLAKLHKWLHKDIVDNRFDDMIVITAPFLLPILLLSMILFTPLMVKTLKILKRKGWIMALTVMVTLPLVFIFLTDVFTVKVILVGISILGYFMFCGILKIEVDDWYKDMRAKLRKEQMIKNKEAKGEDNWVIMR